MADRFSGLAEKLSRLFLGRIKVHNTGGIDRDIGVKVNSHRRSIAVSPLRSVPRLGAALFTEWRKLRPLKSGSLQSLSKYGGLKVDGVTPAITMHKKPGGKAFSAKKRTRVHTNMLRIRNVPVSRKNRLNFLKQPPKIEKASLLALFSPIYKDRVVKSVLDKGTGNLLFWYDVKKVKNGEPHHLLLIRVFGTEEPLQWLWLPTSRNL